MFAEDVQAVTGVVCTWCAWFKDGEMVSPVVLDDNGLLRVVIVPHSTDLLKVDLLQHPANRHKTNSTHKFISYTCTHARKHTHTPTNYRHKPQEGSV